MLGMMEITLLGRKNTFHVVRPNFPTTTEGILGRPFLRDERYSISFFYNALITQSRPVVFIPFVDSESLRAREGLRKEVLAKMYDDDLIVDSNSCYSSSVLIVPKETDAGGNKKWRVVINFRALNVKMEGDNYPIPSTSTILERLGGDKYFSVFDLAMA